MGECRDFSPLSKVRAFALYFSRLLLAVRHDRAGAAQQGQLCHLRDQQLQCVQQGFRRHNNGLADARATNQGGAQNSADRL